MTEISTIQSERTQQILQCASLPSLPNVASKILNKLQNETVTPREITELIECEPAICSRVLSLANSPLYALTRPVATLSHAVVLLGVSTVSQMAIAISTKKVFSCGNDNALEQRNNIYLQSLSSATHARVLAQRFGLPLPDESFLSGVMQDIGKLVLLTELEDEYCRLLADCPDGNSIEKELNWIGTAHDRLGEACGRNWGLPIPIIQAISQHHFPFQEATQPIAQTLMAANYFSRIWGIGFDEFEEVPAVVEIEDRFEKSHLIEAEAICKDSFEAVKAICS
jgi:HD-like signal output (HDOD) protein